MKSSTKFCVRSTLCAAMFAAFAVASAPAFAADPGASAGGPGATSAAQLTSPFPHVLSLVLSQDPQVRSAREALNVSAAELRQARSRLFPSAGVTTNVGRSDQTSLGQGYQQRNNRTEAFLRWNLFSGFNDANQISASDHERLAAVADLQRALDDACQRTLEAYFDWLRLQQQLDRAEQRVLEVTTLADRMQRQFAGGKVSEGDAQLAASALIDAQFARDTLLAERAIARAKVETLAGAPLGLPEPWGLPAVSSLDARDLALDEAVAQARLGNGQWRAAQERAEAARIRIGRVAPDYLPKLDLDLRRSLNDRSNPPISPTTNHAWAVQLSYQIPLGGEIGARRDELSARSRIALAEIDRAEQAVRTELATARHRSAQAQASLESVALQVRYLQDVVRTSEMQFEAGRRSLLQLIQLRDQRFNAEQRSADNAYRMLTAQSQWLATSGALAIALGVAVPEDMQRAVQAEGQGAAPGR